MKLKESYVCVEINTEWAFADCASGQMQRRIVLDTEKR